MQDVAIVTDTVACLTRQQIEQHHVHLVLPRFSINGHEYRDFVDISATEAYRLLDRYPDTFATSAASPPEFLKAFHEAGKAARHILCITVSSRLSAQFDMAQVALGLAKRELPQTTIQIVDSRHAAAAEGLVVLAAARAAAGGRSLAEVVETAEDTAERTHFLAVLETVRYVYRTGRVPKLAVRAGSALNVKPILTCSDGLIRFTGAARTKERGVKRILHTMRGRVAQRPVHVGVMHADAPEEAEALKERIASEFDCVEMWVGDFSPLMGYATGRGLLGFSFYVDSTLGPELPPTGGP